VEAELPAVSLARMAALRSSGTWGSALTADEFAAIRSVGFEPVGQVFGAAVYAAGASSYSCPGTATQVSGQAGAGSFHPLVAAMEQARRTAVGRLLAECEQLGGHGVVGVHVSRGEFALGGTQFVLIGTAVRAIGPLVPGRTAATGPGAPDPHAPFTSDLSGQDFAKLIGAGWVPVGLVLGLSIGARHDDRVTNRQARWTSGNAEIAGWSDLVTQSRHDARRQLESDVARLGADGVVVADMRHRVRQRDCPATVGRRDHVVEAALIGTAIVEFSHAPRPDHGSPLAIMSLDPQRRQTARIRL
jgi:uncharacterized protein YbjQ (UPF0145 family)